MMGTTSTGTRTNTNSDNTIKNEINRLVEDISHAVKSSSLLPLLRRSRDDNNKNNNANDDVIAAVSQSTLNDHILPIRKALERIDPQRLLDLELISSLSPSPSPSYHHQGKEREKKVVKGPRIKDGVYCRPICDQIRPKLCMDDDNDDDHNDSMNENKDVVDDDRNSVVRYLHIIEVPDQYTLGIFVFGPNERIPLHDHPEMCVLSRVLYGDLQRLSLDLDRGGEEEQPVTTAAATSTTEMGNCNEPGNQIQKVEEGEVVVVIEENNKKEIVLRLLENRTQSITSSSWFSRSANWLRSNSCNDNINNNYHYFPQGTKIAFKNTVDLLQAPDVAALYPYEGNLHEFVAGPHGAAVLDVLLPPYDDAQERDCTFYKIHEVAMKQQSSVITKMQTSLSSNIILESNHYSPSVNIKEPCLIIPTGQPENFHCISGRYRDLGESEE